MNEEYQQAVRDLADAVGRSSTDKYILAYMERAYLLGKRDGMEEQHKKSLESIKKSYDN